jgi:fluoroquinolone resistance protein
MTDPDWTDHQAEDAVFTDRVFDRPQFTGTQFAGARFTRCRFLHARFAQADLPGAIFESCTFTAPDDRTEGASFALSNLRAARFLRCDLSLARFDRCDMFDITMDQSTLRGARIHRADFTHAYSRKLVTTRATLRHCNFELADLAELRLPGADLTGSRFREADLTAADLTGANLRDADLFQATLTRAKLANADLRGAEISGLTLTHLASFTDLKITQSQQHLLLDALGIDIQPDP